MRSAYRGLKKPVSACLTDFLLKTSEAFLLFLRKSLTPLFIFFFISLSASSPTPINKYPVSYKRAEARNSESDMHSFSMFTFLFLHVFVSSVFLPLTYRPLICMQSCNRTHADQHHQCSCPLGIYESTSPRSFHTEEWMECEVAAPVLDILH